MSMSRGGSRRGGDRGGEFPQPGPDGWAVAGGPPKPPSKAGDLSNFGKINKSIPMTFGPSSVFAGKKDTKRDTLSLSRTSSSSNIYHLLSEASPDASSPMSNKSNHTSRKASVDLSQAPQEPPMQRRKLVLQPRTVPVEEITAPVAAPPSSDSSSEDEAPAEPTMSEEEANKKIKEDIKEFFGVRNLEEAEEYFVSLPTEHRWRLVHKLVSEAMERKEADVHLVADFFELAASKELCSASSFEEGFAPTVGELDDLAIDVPRAFELMAIMIKGAGLDLDEERRTRLASGTDKLLALLS